MAKPKTTLRGRGEGTYYMEGDLFAWRLKVDGKSIVRKAKTQKELRAKVKAAQAELDQRGEVLSKLDRDTTLGVYLDRWLETAVKPNRATKTYRQYEQLVRLYMKPAFGGLKLQALKPTDVQKALNDLRQPVVAAGPDGKAATTRRALAPATIQLVRVVLRRALNVAVLQKLILSNPVDATERPKAATRRERAMDPDQLQALLDALKADRSRYAPILLVILSTGLRISEALGLEWDDVDRAAKPLPTLAVRRRVDWTPGGEWTMAPLKTDRARRTIPLNSDALQALQRAVALKTGELVFTTETGTPMMERNVQRALSAILTKAKLPHFSLHDLRRTFGTTLANAGVPPHVLQSLMGHENVQTTFGHYTTFFGADAASAVGMMDAAKRSPEPPRK